MKWQKLGKIFDPRDHALASNCKEFAQSPQVVVFPEFVRIYFSTRERDALDKFLSHVAFVDMDRSFERVLRVSSHQVLPLGTRGAFDEHGIFPFSPVRVGDRIYAYTTGWTRRVSVSTDSGIGQAISDDGGETFIRQAQGPVLSASLQEPFLVSDGFVIQHDGQFHMWYIYGQRWIRSSESAAPDRVYKIAHATSTDGINWIKSQRDVIPDRIDVDECQALPTVIFQNDRFHMVFCYRRATDFRRNPERGYRLGHATSIDLIHWQRDDAPVLPMGAAGEWDSEMQCYPHLVRVDQATYLLYNGNEFGRFGFGLARLV
jgi:predicted GH43/DUF377 family glycosyl hydrolase